MNWFSYLIQANLYLVCFYTFYWFILRKETFFNLNRTYLLASALSAALIPLIKVEWFDGAAQPIQQGFVSATVMVMDGYASPIEDTWTFGDVLTLIYLGVILIMTIRLIYKSVKLHQLLKDESQPEAFSFFNKIRINRNLPQQTVIENHEFAHAKQFHSADVLLFEMLSIINWFNPIIYLYKNSIKHIHEFIADELVLKTEIDKRNYALLLLSKNFGVATHTLTNNFFNQSLLKRRIEMMNKTKSRKIAILKYGLSAPLFLLAMVLSSAKISESKTIGKLSEKLKPQKVLSELLMPEHTTSIQNKARHIDRQESISPKELLTTDSKIKIYMTGMKDSVPNKKKYPDVELVPTFPGGIQAFEKFLAENLNYPEKAKKDQIQGKVFCRFLVEKDGNLSDIKVIKGIDKSLDEEAVRVLSLSPKWNPGFINGKTVVMDYTIPILFQLKDEKPGIDIAPSSIDATSKNKPLFMVDGKEFNGDIKDIKPNDIESINVLKDESATKKYGDKGKDGVVEITTKKK